MGEIQWGKDRVYLIIFAVAILILLLFVVALVCISSGPAPAERVPVDMPTAVISTVEPPKAIYSPTIAHMESPVEVEYARLMKAVGDESSERMDALVSGVENWGDQELYDIVAIGGMIREAAEVDCPPGYSQMQMYYQLAGFELDMAMSAQEDGDRTTALVHLRNALNYISLAYLVQGM